MAAFTLTCTSCGATTTVGNSTACATSAPAEVSSVRLPADAKDRDAFNRACRSGRVRGAVKRGRVWTCTLAAWNERAPAQTPRGLVSRKTKGGSVTPIRPADDAVLAELGLGARRTA